MAESIYKVFFVIPMFVFMCIIIAFGSYYSNQTPLFEFTAQYAQIAAVQGGFTTKDLKDIEKAINDSNLKNTTITIKATDSTGADISSKAMNVTPLDSDSQTPNFAPRGSKIYFKIESSDVTILTKVFKAINVDKITHYTSVRHIMSERVL